MSNLQIRARLIEKGETLRSWALRRGWNPRTVLAAIERHSTKANTTHRRRGPFGKMTIQILEDLNQDTGIKVDEE